MSVSKDIGDCKTTTLRKTSQEGDTIDTSAALRPPRTFERINARALQLQSYFSTPSGVTR